MIFQLVAMCHQHTIHHQDVYLVLFNFPKLPGTSKKNWHRDKLNPQTYLIYKKTSFLTGSATSGLLYFPVSCNRHINTALSDSGASCNFVALPQLKLFATNSKDWKWDKPLQVKLSDKPIVISSQIFILFYDLHLAPHQQLLSFV